MILVLAISVQFVVITAEMINELDPDGSGEPEILMCPRLLRWVACQPPLLPLAPWKIWQQHWVLIQEKAPKMLQAAALLAASCGDRILSS